MLYLPIKRCLISLSPSSESLAPSSESFVNPMNAVTLPCTAAILSVILELIIGFVSNFYSWCALSLRTIQRKNEVFILINGWVTANYSVWWRPFCPPSWNLLSDLCQSSTTDVRCHYAQFNEENEVSIFINGWVTAKYSVSRPPFCPPSWNLLSDLCQTSTTHVRFYYAQFSEKKQSLYINKWPSYSQL